MLRLKAANMMKIKNKHLKEIVYKIIKKSEKNVHNVEIFTQMC